MSRGEMLYVFSYDVSEDRRRRRIAKRLEETATRVQLSVFETTLTRTQAEALGQRLAAMLGDGDSLRVYAIGHDSRRRSRIYGDGAPMETDQGYWVV